MVWNISVGQLGPALWLCFLLAPAHLLVSWIWETGEKSPWLHSNNQKHQCYQRSSCTKSKSQQLLGGKLTLSQPKLGYREKFSCIHFKPIVLALISLHLMKAAFRMGEGELILPVLFSTQCLPWDNMRVAEMRTHSVVAMLWLGKLHLSEFPLKFVMRSALLCPSCCGPAWCSMEWVLRSVVFVGVLSLHMAFIVRKLHLGTHSDERNFLWKVMMGERSYLASKLLKRVWFLKTEG